MRSTKTRIETLLVWEWICGRLWSQYEIHQNKDWNNFFGFLCVKTFTSQYEIHQNKDWNLKWLIKFVLTHFVSQYEIHQNKDWNGTCFFPLRFSSCVTIWDPPKQGLKPTWYNNVYLEEPSQYEIHQNKDWNYTLNEYAWVPPNGHNMRSTKTRIETLLLFVFHILKVTVTIWDPPKQGLKQNRC